MRILPIVNSKRDNHSNNKIKFEKKLVEIKYKETPEALKEELKKLTEFLLKNPNIVEKVEKELSSKPPIMPPINRSVLQNEYGPVGRHWPHEGV